MLQSGTTFSNREYGTKLIFTISTESIYKQNNERRNDKDFNQHTITYLILNIYHTILIL